MPSCMRAPPEAVNTISGASCSTASRAAATRPSPTAAPIEPPMNSNAIAADHRLVAADRAVRGDDRVVEMRLVARLAQPVGVALAVAEAQRIGRRLRQLDAVPAALVEGPGQALERGRAHVVAAMRADLEVLLEVACEDHLLAGGALLPEIVRHLAPRRAACGSSGGHIR